MKKVGFKEPAFFFAKEVSRKMIARGNKVKRIVNWKMVTQVLFCILLLTGFLGSTGCEQKKTSSQQNRKLSFVESSVGLPQTGQWRHGIDFFDMNQDGNIDILAPPPRKAPPNLFVDKPVPLIWYGNGLGEWARADIKVPQNLDYAYGDVSADDFDGDGIPDMALAMHGVGVRVLKGIGQGTYEDLSRNLHDLKFGSRALVVDDFDKDGTLDIAAASEMHAKQELPSPWGFVVISSDPDGWKVEFIGKEEELNGLFADQIIEGDVNGDGNPDIGFASLTTFLTKVIWINDGKGTFSEFNKGLPEGNIFLSIALSDLNGDGRDDLVAAISGIGRKSFFGVKAYLSGVDGFTDFSEGLPSNEAFSAVSACDLDNDQRPEIIGVSRKGEFRVYPLRENMWEKVETEGLPKKGLTDPYGVYCVDVNNDGYKDIGVNYAVYNTENGAIKVFLNLAGHQNK